MAHEAAGPAPTCGPHLLPVQVQQRACYVGGGVQDCCIVDLPVGCAMKEGGAAVL